MALNQKIHQLTSVMIIGEPKQGMLGDAIFFLTG
jgi:hypothetical protein